MGGPRFLLSGYYGFGNVGDEALLAVIATQLRAHVPGCEVEVLSATPQETARTYGVEATPRMDMGAIRAAIDRADVVLSGGGGLLQNATSTRSLLYYTEILRRAHRAKKATMIFAQSIGPLDLRGRTIVRWWCGGIDAATVRDRRSHELLSALLPRVDVERAADPVFLLDPPAENGVLQTHGLDPAVPYVVVSVRPAPGFERGVPLLVAAVDRLALEYGAQIAFLPLGGAADAQLSSEIIRRAKSAPTLLPACSIEDAAAIVRGASATIAMRLHAAIFAARFGVPLLAIPYDPKVSSLLADLRYPLEPLFDTSRRSYGTSEQARALADRLWAQRASLSTVLREGAEEQRRLALRSFELAAQLANARA